MKHTERAELLGLSFDTVTTETAVARCLKFCRAPRASHMVMTANAFHLCMMRHDAELASACRAGHLIVADGMSIVWALRASGQPAPERVAGIDLMARLLTAAGEHRLRSISSAPGARWSRSWRNGAAPGTPDSDRWLPRRLLRPRRSPGHRRRNAGERRPLAVRRHA